MADESSDQSVSDQLDQLSSARTLVLGDAAYYPRILKGILPIIGSHARVELQRWGADFIAETFASPVLSADVKSELSQHVLPTLKAMLEKQDQDNAVVQSAVQAAASLYPIVFRHIINNPSDESVWGEMAAIKQNILRRWDAAPTSIKSCCIKFVQRVVLVQTPGLIADPRRPEQNETSLSIVPRNHPLIPPPNLEAEASGLLDRLLNVFHDSNSEPIIIIATLNCLSPLMKNRPAVANRIIGAILNFNPLKLANSPMTPRNRVLLKSLDRTTRALLMNMNKRMPHNPMASKIHAYLERMSQQRNDIQNGNAPQKRGPPEPTDGLDNAKRARLAADNTPPKIQIPPLPPGPNSYSQLFTLTNDVGLTSFDVKQLPIDMIVNITLAILPRIQQPSLDEASNGVRTRYDNLRVLENQQRLAAQAQKPEEDDDDYEPDYQPEEDDSAAGTAAEAANVVQQDYQPDLPSLGPFILPQPPPLTQEESEQLGQATVQRVFRMMTSLEDPAAAAQKSAQQQKSGFSRLAGSTFDRDSWITIMTRLATRAPLPPSSIDEEANGKIAKEEDTTSALAQIPTSTMPETIRELLFRYILEDFRSRISVAISWVSEEWYATRVRAQVDHAAAGGDDDRYSRLVLKIVDGILPYLDARDAKVLIRFLSEVPELHEQVILRVKTLARDPERVNLCIQALHYLILMRPPVREMCLDTLEELHKVEECRVPAAKVLSKWRPDVVAPKTEATKEEPASDGQANGTGASNGTAVGA